MIGGQKIVFAPEVDGNSPSKGHYIELSIADKSFFNGNAHHYECSVLITIQVNFVHASVAGTVSMSVPRHMYARGRDYIEN